jgi:hypothetical protein
VGGERRRRKKGCSTVGMGTLYSHQRRWTTATWRRGNGGRGNSGSEAVGMGKVAAANVSKRSARSGRRQSERLTLEAHGVLIFPIYSKLDQLGNKKECLILHQKFLNFSCCYIGAL